MMMQTAIRVAAMAVGLAAMAGAATAQNRQVLIHNDTGYTLYRFYSTNSGSTKWGSDVMGSSTLASGSAMRLNFDNSYGYCVFDFRAVFEDGSDLQRSNVNVCEISDYYYKP